MSQTKPANLSFEDRLDASPLTRSMGLLWALSAGLIALDGFDFFIIGVALPFIQRDFGIDATATGAIATAALVGSLVGALTLGPITDRVGRQRMLVLDVALFVLASAATALAWNAASLIGFRFLVGVAIGADYPISVSYITENVPTRLRGRMVVGAFTFQAIGALLGAITGLLVIAGFQAAHPHSLLPLIHYGWRWMLGVGFIMAIAVAILRSRFLLESPRYYIAKGDYAAASEAASTLLGTPITLTADIEPPPQARSVGYGTLFSQPYLRRTLLATVPWFLQDIATYGIGIFTPVIIATLAFSSETNFVAKELAATQGSALVDLFLIAGFLLAIALVDRVGRIPLQIAGFLGMAVGLSLLASSTMLPVASAINLSLVFAGFIVFNLLMNMGPNATTFLLSGEVFPTAIRATGAGFAAAVAKAGAVLGAFALPLLEQRFGAGWLLLGLALVCVLAALLTAVLRVESSGRSLETIGESPSAPELPTHSKFQDLGI